jgi:glutamine amidotransferase
MVVIVDYGLGNLGSIENMLKKINVKCKISGETDDIYAAEKLILPGVGSFDDGMKNLNDKGLKEVLNKKVIEERTPILGICLGMQLMTNGSQEGVLPGLGWIDAESLKFSFSDRTLKIPHMGWNLTHAAKDNTLFGNYDEERFYFVHSYYVKLNEANDELAYTEYGVRFTSSFQRDNIYGVQFHPEKSHKFGMSLLRNFCL